MQIRESRISDSILGALAHEDDPTATKPTSKQVIEAVYAFFALFRLFLARYRAADFLTLRHDAWQMDEVEYLDSFKIEHQHEDPHRHGPKAPASDAELIPIGDLGYSGSTFFTTPNSKFLIKSLPRRFEHTFFTHDLFDAYVAHMKAHPTSLLVRITDMVFTPHATIGGIIGTAPTHHIIMANLLYGKERAGAEAAKKKWETYDLKPHDFFFPERDILDGALVPESVLDKLFDEFPGKIEVSETRRAELLDTLGRDTQLLADHNAIDYSLFVVRFPGPSSEDRDREIPVVKGVAHDWTTGVDDATGEWTYRVVVLDFFWAKHKFHAKAMTGLVNTFNFFARKGPMSITADPIEYRERFLGMVDDLVVAV